MANTLSLSEWISKVSENESMYVVEIKNFDRKMKTFFAGREICSKEFKIGSTTLCIEIIPKEDENWSDAEDYSDSDSDVERENYVGVFIRNLSDWRIKGKVTFRLRYSEYEKQLREASIFGGDRRGWYKFISHSRCVDELYYDNFILQVDIKLLEEEVPSSRNLVLENPTVQLGCLEKAVTSLKNDFDEKFQDLKNAIENNNAVSSSKSHKQIECPVCLEIVAPPMRLMQCGQGHIICDPCYEKSTREKKKTNVGLCYSCKLVITGRPSALEKLLGLV